MVKPKYLLACIVGATLGGSAVLAQPAPSGQFAPITLDQPKFIELWGKLRKIEATADVHERISAIMNGLEQQAQKERALSAIPRPPAPPPVPPKEE